MIVKAELTFPSVLKDEAVICNLCKQFNIILKIVEASFSTDTGWAILTIEAAENEVERTFEHLKNLGIEIKNIQKVT